MVIAFESLKQKVQELKATSPCLKREKKKKDKKCNTMSSAFPCSPAGEGHVVQAQKEPRWSASSLWRCQGWGIQLEAEHMQGPLNDGKSHHPSLPKVGEGLSHSWNLSEVIWGLVIA